MLRLFALLLLTSGCSGLCPRDGSPEKAACEQQIEDDRATAQSGWRNGERARDERSAPRQARFASDLKRGMTRTELSDLAGAPDRRQAIDGRETWSFYVDGQRALAVTLVDGLVTQWRHVVR